MRGAVLHKLGLDFVKNRMIRVNYGTESRVPFQEGYHPEFRRVLDYDGLPRCKGVMHWFAKKVLSQIASVKVPRVFLLRTEPSWKNPFTRIIRKKEERVRNHIFQLTNSGYVTKTQLRNIWIQKVYPMISGLTLVMKMHVRLTVDLKELPSRAWERRKGRDGAYRRVQYELGLSFGAGGIEWFFRYDGKIIGSVKSEYI